MNRKKYCIANWKMNFIDSDIVSFIKHLTLYNIDNSQKKIILCPSYTFLKLALKLTQNTNISISAQNVSSFIKGAYTGEVSCEMLKSFGIKTETKKLCFSPNKIYFLNSLLL